MVNAYSIDPNHAFVHLVHFFWPRKGKGEEIKKKKKGNDIKLLKLKCNLFVLLESVSDINSIKYFIN